MDKELSKIFKDLAFFYELEDQIYRSKAFNIASENILGHEIVSGENARKNIYGIGKSIAEVIDEYLETGKVDRLNKLRDKYLNKLEVIDFFTTIHGIGPVAANKLYDEGYRTLEDLKSADLTHAQEVGVRWYHDLNKRIMRREMISISKAIYKILDDKFECEVVGSFRRKMSTSGDVDLLVKRNKNYSLSDIVDLLSDLIVDTIALGETKFMGIIKLKKTSPAHRLDIRYVEEYAYAPALMYFTGSQNFNIEMRKRAQELGYLLNEYGLSLKKKFFEVETEEDIFDLLGVAYLSPEERTDDVKLTLI